jgi:RNA polymerase sigma factor (sigma-70 family)
MYLFLKARNQARLRPEKVAVRTKRGVHRAIRWKSPEAAPEELRMLKMTPAQVGRLRQALDAHEAGGSSMMIEEFRRQNYGYIHNVVRAVANKRLPQSWRATERYDEAVNDAEQEAFINLLDAIHKYDPAKGAKFGTFATNVITRAAHYSMRRPAQTGREEVSSELGGSLVSRVVQAGPEEAVIMKMLLEDVYKQLNPRDRKIAEMRVDRTPIKDIAVSVGTTEKVVEHTIERKIEPLFRQLVKMASTGELDEKVYDLLKSTCEALIDPSGRVLVKLG